MTLYTAIDDPHEIADHYQEQYDHVAVTGEPDRPIKKLNQTHESYGKQLDEYEQALAIHRQLTATYNQERSAILIQLKRDLFDALGITNHPKREKAWEMAWANRQRGFVSVANFLEQLSEIM